MIIKVEPQSFGIFAHTARPFNAFYLHIFYVFKHNVFDNLPPIKNALVSALNTSTDNITVLYALRFDFIMISDEQAISHFCTDHMEQ